MKKDLHDISVIHFFEAILSLNSIDECYAFYKDICTTNEIMSVAQRFEVGKMLLEKKTYQDIQKATNASTTTISRVNRLLNDEDNGIEMAYARIKEKNND
ncbi:MAG: YerC/YecD family TrpR-related protein [bacterium]